MAPSPQSILVWSHCGPSQINLDPGSWSCKLLVLIFSPHLPTVLGHRGDLSGTVFFSPACLSASGLWWQTGIAVAAEMQRM